MRTLDGGGWAIAGVPLGPVPSRGGHNLDGRPSWLEVAAPSAFASAPPLRPHVLRQGKQDSELESGLTWPRFDDLTIFIGLRIALKLRKKGASSVHVRPNIAMTGISPVSSVCTGTAASPVRHFSLPGHGSSASIHALMAASERGMAFAP